MVRFAQDVGFAISFLPVELLDEKKDGIRNWEARFIRYRPEMGVQGDPAQVAARIDKAYDMVIDMKSKGMPILNSTPYLEASRMYLKTGRFPAEGCDAGRLYFSIAPNGQFTVCHRTVQQHLHFLDPNFDEYFESMEYELKRKMEVASCDGCMRACWIDTSSMFRNMQAFFETAKLTTFPRRRQPIDHMEAQTWARHDDIAIVPETVSAK